MPGGRPDPSAVVRSAAPGQIGIAVLAVAAGVAGLVVLAHGGAWFWVCVPAALFAAGWCRAPGSTALATAVVVAAAGAGAAAAGHPPAWAAATLVPAASVGVLQRRRAALERERDGLRDSALTDPLTSIANRRALLARAEHEIARHRRAGRPFALVMLDLDGFKALNDRFGHGAGDDLLRDVAVALRRAMRAQDTVARIGGDEFCVLAPETGRAGVARLTGRVGAAVRDVTAGTTTVHGSVGAAVYPGDATDPLTLMQVADARLLEAKRTLYRGGRPARRAA
jgi:diguanylate cyclase (GGDEF)-like protein